MPSGIAIRIAAPSEMPTSRRCSRLRSTKRPSRLSSRTVTPAPEPVAEMGRGDLRRRPPLDLHRRIEPGHRVLVERAFEPPERSQPRRCAGLCGRERRRRNAGSNLDRPRAAAGRSTRSRGRSSTGRSRRWHPVSRPRYARSCCRPRGSGCGRSYAARRPGHPSSRETNSLREPELELRVAPQVRDPRDAELTRPAPRACRARSCC